MLYLFIIVPQKNVIVRLTGQNGQWGLVLIHIKYYTKFHLNIL